MNLSQFSRLFNSLVVLTLIVSSVGCGSLPWQKHSAPKDIAYQEYMDQSETNFDYQASAGTPPPPVRLSGSPPASPSDRITSAADGESCTSGCCH